jgi:hypothetical protein
MDKKREKMSKTGLYYDIKNVMCLKHVRFAALFKMFSKNLKYTLTHKNYIRNDLKTGLGYGFA